MTIAEFWPLCLQHLKQQLSTQQYSMWIAPLTVGEENGQWLVYTPNNFLFGHVKKQFWPHIQAAKAELAPADAPELTLKIGQGLRLEAAGNAAPAAAANTAAKQTPSAEQIIGKHLQAKSSSAAPATPAATAISAPNTAVPDSKPAAGKRDTQRLSPEFTFDTLVVGKGNEVAVAVARNISENPGGSYNPFFLYSSPGLGKTHLVQAIGHTLLQLQPKAKVAYIHGQDYLRSVMNAARNNTFDALKQKYKQYDLLILDDVQFIADKTRTMEEFFYLFNHFYNERKQIILTSDELPENIDRMDVRLKTRFSQGLTMRLEPPEFEMRVAILQKKAQLAGVKLEEDAAFFIAKHIQGSVRYLEGAFKRVEASSRFTGKPINIDLATHALKDLVASAYKVITTEMIMEAVAGYYKIGIGDLTGKKRTRNIARPRQMAMMLTKELTNLSLPAIGSSFGGRDHTTVMHAVKTIADLRKESPDTERDYQKLLILIKN